MAQAPLDPGGGESPLIHARVLSKDATRLAALAEHFGVPVSRVIRVALAHGLIELEKKQEPPGEGGQPPDN